MAEAELRQSLLLVALFRGGRFGVSWAGLALITGSGRLCCLIRLLGTKTRCLAGREGGRKEAEAWGRGWGWGWGSRALPSPEQEGLAPRAGALPQPVLSPSEGGEWRGIPDPPGLSLACGCLILLEDPSTPGEGAEQGVRVGGTLVPS